MLPQQRQGTRWLNWNVVEVAVLVAALAALGRPAHAQAPVPGQAYQLPAGYEGSVAGTIISYGGYNYAVQTDGTMVLVQSPGTAPATPLTAQAYRIPAGYGTYAPGSTITYGGYSYIIQSNGTMVLAQPGYTSYYVGSGYTTPYPGSRYWPGRGPRPWPGPRRGQWTTGMFGQPIRVPGSWQRMGGNSFYDPRTGRRILVD